MDSSIKTSLFSISSPFLELKRLIFISKIWHTTSSSVGWLQMCSRCIYMLHSNRESLLWYMWDTLCVVIKRAATMNRSGISFIFVCDARSTRRCRNVQKSVVVLVPNELNIFNTFVEIKIRLEAENCAFSIESQPEINKSECIEVFFIKN